MSADAFRPLFEGLRGASDHLLAAAQEMVAATNALHTVIELALVAHEEHEDVRESVRRLEALVIEQGRDLRALRDRFDPPHWK